MKMQHVQEVSAPTDGLLAGCLSRIDFADAYSVPVTDAQANNLDDLTRTAFKEAPVWIKRLMQVRNALVRPLGLKTSSDANRVSHSGPLRPGDRVGIFRVYARTPDEVLMGEDDKHLNFRVSVRAQGETGAKLAVVTTVVQFNSRLGRLYFLPVRPFHRLVVPAILRRTIEKANVYPST